MRAAFIVVGAELCAWEQAETLLDYLKNVAGIRHATICPGWNRNEGSLKSAFVYHATKAAKQPLLLSYIGHGYRDACSGAKGWSYGVDRGDKDLRLPYATLLEWIAEYREGPTLILNARNDPFLPEEALERAARGAAPSVVLEFPRTGGHAGFPGRDRWMARRVLEFLSAP